MENLSFTLSLILAAVVSCTNGKRENEQYIADDAKTFPASELCKPGDLNKLVASYNFEGELTDYFEQHPDWQDNPSEGVINDASFYQRNGQMEFEVLSASMQASEAWWKWNESMSPDKSWKICADLTVPEKWLSGENKEYQIGVGLFVGKPEGLIVFEVDFSAMADGTRFVLSQNIHNRRGGDPNYVGMTVPDDGETINMEIMYCAKDKSLSIYYNGIRVDTQLVDSEGIFDWEIGSEYHVGIMGFSEGPACLSDFLYIDNWKIFE